MMWYVVVNDKIVCVSLFTDFVGQLNYACLPKLANSIDGVQPRLVCVHACMCVCVSSKVVVCSS